MKKKHYEGALEESLHDFYSYLKNRNMSDNTIRAYLYAAEQFLTQYGTISHDNLLLYKCYLMEHYKPKTVNLRIRAINCLLESLQITSNHISMIRIHQKSFLENVISLADYHYFKKCLLQDRHELYYFAIWIMATTGMRISELLQVQVNDVRRGFLDIYSKGNKMRRIYIPQQVRTDCLQWLEEIDRSNGPVFLNHHNQLITPAGLRNQLKKLTLFYGLNPTVVYPHAFRHLFAKNFIEVCSDIALLSDILGHKSIETTRIYLHRSSSEQQQMINQIVDW